MPCAWRASPLLLALLLLLLRPLPPASAQFASVSPFEPRRVTVSRAGYLRPSAPATRPGVAALLLGTALLLGQRAAGQFVTVAPFVAVIAHFQEPLEGCLLNTAAMVRHYVGLNAPILVYSKGQPVHPKPLWVHSYLPNVGREGDAYLAFIIHNYDSLPHHTLFAQPCHSPDGVEAALKTFVPATTQVLNLGGFEHGTLNGTAAYPMRHLCELYMLSHGNASCPGEEAPFFSYMGSQFVVSRERLRRNPLALYQLLRDRLASPLDDPLHGDIEAVPDAEKRAHFWAQTRGPSGTNYYSYQLERGWAVLFDCMRLTTDAC